MKTMGNSRHLELQIGPRPYSQITGRQAEGRGRRRHPFLRRLEYVFWFAGAAAGVWFVLASLGIISFQVTQARRLEKLETDAASGAAASGLGASASMGPLQPGDPFGRISIPHIGLSAMV